MARRITDAALGKLQPRPGKWYDFPIPDVPGLFVRVGDKGHKSFVLRARFPMSWDQRNRRLVPWEDKPQFSRVSLGRVGVMSLDGAREKARRWSALIEKNVDPRAEEQRQKREERRRQAATFGVVAEGYIRWRHLNLTKNRRAHRDEQEIRRELIPAWGARPITEITRFDVGELIKAIRDRPAPATAHLAFGHARGIFNWVIDEGVCDLEASPCDRVRPAKLIGEKGMRNRVLNDDELRAFWRATGKMGYPYGPLLRLILLTGARRGEVSDARWREFPRELVRFLRDPEHEPDTRPNWSALTTDARTWTISPERFKSKKAHILPLSDDALGLLDALPTFRSGDHLFSTTFGTKPCDGFSKAKERLDRLMLLALRASARTHGEQWHEVTLPPFVIHDLRRTVRTRLPKLKVPTEVAEMVIGHKLKGLHAVYDQHGYEDEMRDALDRWAAMLRAIVSAPPTPGGDESGKVVRLRRSA